MELVRSWLHHTVGFTTIYKRKGISIVDVVEKKTRFLRQIAAIGLVNEDNALILEAAAFLSNVISQRDDIKENDDYLQDEKIFSVNEDYT